jgi:hypothetical protein
MDGMQAEELRMFRALLDAVEADKARSQARVKSLTMLLAEVSTGDRGVFDGSAW